MKILLFAALAIAPLACRAQDAAPKPFATARVGVNLAGAEFGDNAIPGVFGKQYTYPAAESLDYYAANQIALIRLPFKWERMQRSLRAPLDADEVAHVRDVLRAAGERKMEVILDVHNYGRYQFAGDDGDEKEGAQIIGAGRVTPADFADFWSRLAIEFKDEPALVGYGLMNEPHDMDDEDRWPRAAQAAIDAIRAVDTDTPIVVAGDNWSSSRNWKRSSNAQLHKKLNDPTDNLVFEAHCYFDKDGSGQYKADYETELGSPAVGVENVRPFVEWCRENEVRGLVGEFGIPSDEPRWLETADRFLDYLRDNRISATYWAGGPWWGQYPLSVEPGENGAERPQMSVLRKYAS